MELHKWRTNASNLRSNISEEKEYSFSCSSETKALGILWDHLTDCFSFKVLPGPQNTKRAVLSNIGRIFDPLEVHGFADASERAYGAVVYLKSSAGERNCVHLLCSKSRVAPLKSISVPTLELCSALLLALLVKRVLRAIKLQINDVYLWSDSTIVLARIQHEPLELKTFVANRIAAIQELTKKEQWFYVSSENNLADVLSRGLAPEKLCNNELWWASPSFLQADFPVPMSTPNSNDGVYLSELKTSKPIFLTLNAKEKELFMDCLLSVTNSYLKLIRVMSFIFRFIFNSRNPHSLRSGPLTGDEVKAASEYLIKEVQHSNSAKGMRIAVWAIYFHTRSTEKEPLHSFCPAGETSWCKYHQAVSKGTTEQNSLPPAVMDAIKPIFNSLSHPELLNRCLGAYTQNTNESLNSVIWQICPKISAAVIGLQKLLSTNQLYVLMRDAWAD
ncbi:hypothetical protein AVEN_151640-1 [Araneus ventricosus]|uniref:Uncharacterized protein n=1 Tax=Araneus ventricosus TaxID=182803 RepID=A0A4Y2RS96_ARAVE|nr:hypothetical protein AVEN_151640-1 [Araneus ventricosus]